jgi:hypothetical protein
MTQFVKIRASEPTDGFDSRQDEGLIPTTPRIYLGLSWLSVQLTPVSLSRGVNRAECESEYLQLHLLNMSTVS